MIKLIEGDALEKMQDIPDRSIDLVLADPPFGTTKCKWDSVISLDPMWEQINRIRKPNTAILLFSQIPFSIVLGSSNLEMLRYEIIWEKPNGTGFLNADKMPIKAHENILVFYEKLPVYNPQKTTGHERKTAGKKKVLSEHYGKSIRKTHYDSTDRFPRSVLKVSSDKQKNRGLHPSRKPSKLISNLIMTYSDEGMTVLDFCMGSGTTGEESVKLKRNFIGIEKDSKDPDESKYFEVAKKRIEDTDAQISF